MPFNRFARPFPPAGAGGERERVVGSEERGAEGPSGPADAPRPGERAPHEDVGQLVNDFIGDLQGAGDTICSFLDKPFDSLGFKGPHRLADGILDLQAGLVRNVVTHTTRWKER